MPSALHLIIAIALSAPLDLNRADDATLRAAGFTASQAAQIVRYRTENGAFLQVEELLAVPQISPAALAPLRAGLTVAGAPTAAVVPEVVTAGHPVRLRDLTGEWRNLYGLIVYAVNGSIENSGARPLHAVRVRLELLDQQGAVVASSDGTNLGAERLLNEPDAATDALPAIAAGGRDPVRLTIDKGDIARPFRTARLTVVEVR